MNCIINNYRQFIFLFVIMIFSCVDKDSSLIQLPDTTAPTGYIVSPLNGSSVSGNTSLQIIAIDNEEVDTVFFMIKGQNDNNYRNIDSTTNVSNDIWQGSWDTQNSQWVENENYFITFKAIDLVGNTYIASPIIVKLDNQDDEAPNGYIKNPITGQTVNGIVSIEVEATDNKAIQYVSIFVNNEIKITPIANKIKIVAPGEIDIFFKDKVGTLLTSKIATKIVKYGVKFLILKFKFKSVNSKIKGNKINIPPAGAGTPSK